MQKRVLDINGGPLLDPSAKRYMSDTGVATTVGIVANRVGQKGAN
jgi:hypothetical protein